MVNWQVIAELEKENRNDPDAKLLFCSAKKAIFPLSNIDNLLTKSKSYDYEKIFSIYGKRIDFRMNISKRSIDIIGILFDAGYSGDQITNRNIFVFDEGKYELELSTSGPGMKYGHHYKGVFDRYSGEISIYSDKSRSGKLDNIFILKGSCKLAEKII